MKGLNVGDLRHQITIQQMADTTDDYGTPVETDEWNTFATVWAAINPLTGREYIQTQNVIPDLTATIKIRYLPGVTTRMRVLYGTRVFDIKAVIDVEEHHREMQLMCAEVIL